MCGRERRSNDSSEREWDRSDRERRSHGGVERTRRSDAERSPEVVKPPIWLPKAFMTPGDLEWLQKIVFAELPQTLSTY